MIQNCQSRGLIRNILDNQIDIYSFISDGRRLDETRELSIFVLFDRGQVSSDLMLLFGTKYYKLIKVTKTFVFQMQKRSMDSAAMKVS